MKKRSGITLTMLVIYMVILSIIMGAVVLNLGYNNQIEELDKSTYQAKILDYIEQFTTMKNYYTIKGEYNDEIMTRQNEQDIYGRTIADYIGSITMEDKEYLCIYNGELHTFGMDTEDTRYGYIQELGITQVEYVGIENDNEPPKITVTQKILTQNKNVEILINVTDNVGLANNNTYKYYLSTSINSTVGGEWKSYTNNQAFVVGANLNGTYYLHVKGVRDIKGNMCSEYVTDALVFTNEFVACTVTSDVGNNVTSNSSTTYTITFSQFVNNFDINDITAINGTKQKLQGSGNVYTLTVNNTVSGIQKIIIPQGCCTDQYGNWNSETSINTSIDIDGPIISSCVLNTYGTTNCISLNATDTAGIAGYNITKSNTQPNNWFTNSKVSLYGLTTKTFDNATWVKVFSHQPASGTVLFANSAEALCCNTTGKYSILNRLEEFRGSDNSFEFMLEYNNSTTAYNRWKQTSNPTTTTESVTGYQAISISWTGDLWGGLALSNSGSTFIDGSINHAYWWYAIGSYLKYDSAIPGYNDNSNISSVDLWVKIEDAQMTGNTLNIKTPNISTNGIYYVWAKDKLGNVSNKQVNVSMANSTLVSATSNISIYLENDTEFNKYNVTTSSTQPTEWIDVSTLNLSDVETKRFANASWARIFSHNNKSGTVLFSNQAEALSCSTVDKYSILSRIEEFRDANDSFEFLLQYPKDSTTAYNRWKQTSNPTTTKESVTGYQAVSISWTSNYWAGLALSNTTSTLIDGSINHSNWFYAIGAYAKYDTGIPTGTGSTANVAELWARIDNLSKKNVKNYVGKIGNINSSTTNYIWIKDINNNVVLKGII